MVFARSSVCRARGWPFARAWANIVAVAVVVLLCFYLLGLASELLIKGGKGTGGQSVQTSEVEESVRNAAIKRGARVSRVRCAERPQNQWHCTIRLANGTVVSGNATWYESHKVLGVNVSVHH
jgi:hypothetical protein